MVSKYNKDPNYEHKVLQALAMSRAFESEAYLVMVNAGGDKADGFMGGSGVWAPLLGRIDGFEGPEVGLKVVDIDLGLLEVSVEDEGADSVGRPRDVQDTRRLGRQGDTVMQSCYADAGVESHW
jgi:predicted amidohydrolase